MAGLFTSRSMSTLLVRSWPTAKKAVDNLYCRRFYELEKKKAKLEEYKKIDNWKPSMSHIKGNFN